MPEDKKRKISPNHIVFCIALLLLFVIGFILHIKMKKEEKDKKEANMRVILKASEMYGMERPTEAQKRKWKLEELRDDWLRLASKTKKLTSEAPNIEEALRIIDNTPVDNKTQLNSNTLNNKEVEEAVFEMFNKEKPE
jgi:hypothetical protein